MEIIYLKHLANIDKIGGWETKGISLQEIVELERKYNEGKPFPKSYREYLYLAGRISGITLDSGFGFDWLQETSKGMLKEFNQSIDRPFFVIDQLDGCEQFGFFYLDEEGDDPIIYNCAPPYVEDGDPLIKPYNQGRFSKVIESKIEEAKVHDRNINE